MNWQTAMIILDDLQREPDAHDWAVRVLEISETIWTTLASADEVNTQYVKRFTKLLELPQAFDLARLVIPDFRDDTSTPSNPFKSQVLERVEHKRHRLMELETATSTQIDTPLYRQEKTVFRDMEIFQAGVLLYNSGVLTTEQHTAVIEWLAKAPEMIIESRS